ncbi:unnamed protein product [Protopolystoma xenopodis]|uniref:Uncharacterized protein n=1 Tax=Protopolystoma xenopodis TaxID=117903 RepID=A0A448WGN5_9PLAT|nr:unnamed protein product [Protopolystoma xenopodis]
MVQIDTFFYPLLSDTVHFLVQEHNTYHHTLEALEIEIKRTKLKLEELISVYKDALMIQEETNSELQRHEELVYAHRKRRELEITNLRRLFESKRNRVSAQKALLVSAQQPYPELKFKIS